MRDAAVLAAMALCLAVAPATRAASSPITTTSRAPIDEPRRIAAAIVAADRPAPTLIVEVGAHHGEFLEVFLERFKMSRGLWIEPANDEGNLPIAKARLVRFAPRVEYAFGCAARDISDGCVPQGADVIITDWVSVHQNLDGIYRQYRLAAERLPVGGWIVNIDHVGFGGSDWEPRMKAARKDFRPTDEAPPVHHPDYRVPTAHEQLGALRAAGFDAQVVWRSFDTVLFVGRKR
jgi:hypothetical protein